ATERSRTAARTARTAGRRSSRCSSISWARRTGNGDDGRPGPPRRDGSRRRPAAASGVARRAARAALAGDPERGPRGPGAAVRAGRADRALLGRLLRLLHARADVLPDDRRLRPAPHPAAARAPLRDVLRGPAP